MIQCPKCGRTHTIKKSKKNMSEFDLVGVCPNCQGKILGRKPGHNLTTILVGVGLMIVGGLAVAFAISKLSG